MDIRYDNRKSETIWISFSQRTSLNEVCILRLVEFAFWQQINTPLQLRCTTDQLWGRNLCSIHIVEKIHCYQLPVKS